MRGEFLLFGLTLAGVALLHHHTLAVALTGLGAILLFKFAFVDSFGLVEHLGHEKAVLLNLLGLLLGFAVLAKHFEESQVPQILPRFLPDGLKGGFALLALVFVLSSFLDNIAAAIIGGAVALAVFNGRVCVGYLAAIVAASNAGGSGSVLGDTTTTMMWIDGVAALDVIHAYVAAVPALLVSGLVAARQQHRFQPIQREEEGAHRVVPGKILVVLLILAGAILGNVMLDFPAAGVWAAILVGATFTRTSWQEIPKALRGSLFLLSLVMCASMMPVEELPTASWQTAFGLGFLSAVSGATPLTKLALEQGGYDWGVLAYAVGYGGSMIWFGSSAGVALSSMYPQAKSARDWLREGWHVTLAYVVGFFIMLYAVGWEPHAPHKEGAPVPAAAGQADGR
ncbi:MAG: citrate transporter [Candidatus Handelsmanbacteria bacterium]|nr:citrate transporter [Candidatus Handelsmanbacteria bacterium]